MSNILYDADENKKLRAIVDSGIKTDSLTCQTRLYVKDGIIKATNESGLSFRIADIHDGFPLEESVCFFGWFDDPNEWLRINDRDGLSAAAEANIEVLKEKVRAFSGG